MYQYPNQHPSMQNMQGAGNNSDLFLRLDNLPPANSSISMDGVTIKQDSISAPTSTNGSPYMSMDQPEDEDLLENFNPKSRRASTTTLNKAERRAEHNAIERARRECLNSKFQQLAEALPNLQNHRRPSKGQIVEKALDWVRQNMTKEDRYQYQIMQLQNENKRLLTQINIQQDGGIVTPPISAVSPVANAPFPVDLRHQQYPVNSTSSDATSSGSSSKERSENKLQHPTMTNAAYLAQQQQAAEELNVMYPMAAPFDLDWHQQSLFVAGSADYAAMPSASSSSSSSKYPVDDDDESHSSGEEQNYHHVQISYNDMSLFDMSNQPNNSTSIASWSSKQPFQQYPPYSDHSSMPPSATGTIYPATTNRNTFYSS